MFSLLKQIGINESRKDISSYKKRSGTVIFFRQCGAEKHTTNPFQINPGLIEFFSMETMSEEFKPTVSEIFEFEN